MQMAERIRVQYETSMQHSESAAYQVTAVDAFFKGLISDRQKDLGNQ